MKAILRKQIHNGFANDVWLKIEFNIDFTPCIGLYLIKGDLEETIMDLYYDITKEQWNLITEEDNTFNTFNRFIEIDKNYRETTKFENLINAYLDLGWEEEK